MTFSPRHPLIKRRYTALLATLVFLMITAPLTPLIQRLFPILHGSAGITPQTLILTLVTAWTAWHNLQIRFTPLLIGAITVVTLGILSVFAHATFIQIHLLAQIVFLGFALVPLLREILTTRNVDADTLAGSVCVYLLLGVIGGLVFGLIEASTPGSFYVTSELSTYNGSNLVSDPGLMIYFAFVTLTTVGYGDIMPATEAARSASMLLAVLGQLTLVVLISRLVGLHVAVKAPQNR